MGNGVKALKGIAEQERAQALALVTVSCAEERPDVVEYVVEGRSRGSSGTLN